MRKEQPICDKIAFLYVTLIRFGQNHSLNLVLIAVAHEGDLVGVFLAISDTVPYLYRTRLCFTFSACYL